MAKLRITLQKSVIGSTETQKATVKALGLHKIRDFVEQEDSKTLRGQLAKVSHLLKVEEL